MEDDNLLIKVKEASFLKIDPQYIAVDSVNSSNPEEFIQELVSLVSGEKFSDNVLIIKHQ